MLKTTQPLISACRRFIGVLAVAGLTAGTMPTPQAHAAMGALMTGRALVLLCTSKKEVDVFGCENYIAGVVDYHHLIKGLGTAPTVNFCLPEKLTMAQMRSIVTAYIMTRTEHQDFVASPGVAMALYNAFPCVKKRR